MSKLSNIKITIKKKTKSLFRFVVKYNRFYCLVTRFKRQLSNIFTDARITRLNPESAAPNPWKTSRESKLYFAITFRREVARTFRGEFAMNRTPTTSSSFEEADCNKSTRPPATHHDDDVHNNKHCYRAQLTGMTVARTGRRRTEECSHRE